MWLPINFGIASTAYRSAGYAAGASMMPVLPAEAAAAAASKTAVNAAQQAAVRSTGALTWGEGLSLASTAISAILGNVAANRANRQGARALRQQAGIYDAQAGLALSGAGDYAKQAGMAADLGRGNARNLRLAAAQLDRYEQYKLREATLEARQRVGHGRVGFAANGVLADSGSAAMWEQDEAADAVLERLDIMQQFEDQGWQYRTQANRAEAEGYAAAAQQMGAAAAAAGQAYAARLQAAAARAQAARLKRRRSWGATIGAVLGGAAGAALIPGVGAWSGAAIGASLGGSGGQVYDAFA